MPEAPWIRRFKEGADACDQELNDGGCGIKFTDNILMREDDDDELSPSADVDGGGGIDISQIRDEFIGGEDYDEGLSLDNTNKIIPPNKMKGSGKDLRRGKSHDHKNSAPYQMKIFQDESPYLQQSLDVVHKPTAAHGGAGLGEQILKQPANNAMMLY